MPYQLIAWSNFYVIIGSASAALTGLQFVVVALAADRRTITQAGARTFATPTIVHFCVVLLLSAILSAPWRRLLGIAIGLKLCGLGGLVYSFVILIQARRQKDYQPVLEDWIWHVAIPTVAYAAILVSAFAFLRYPEPVLFFVGALLIVLLFVGIHNAWDSAIYIAISHRDEFRPTE